MLKNVYDMNQRRALLANAFEAAPEYLEEKRVIIFDGLYDSGATLTNVTVAVLQMGRASNAYALALTKEVSRNNLPIISRRTRWIFLQHRVLAL